MMIPPETVLQEGVVSKLGGTVAPDAFILTNAERQADYAVPEPLVKESGAGRGAAAAAAIASQEAARRVVGIRHRRDWDEVDEKGFRRCEGRGEAATSSLICSVCSPLIETSSFWLFLILAETKASVLALGSVFLRFACQEFLLVDPPFCLPWSRRGWR